MYASLSAESRIQDRLDALRMTTSCLAALDGRMSNSKLSQALRGIKALENSDATRLLELTARLVELQDAFRPIPLDLSAPAPLATLLKSTASTSDIREMVAKIFGS